MSGVHHAATGPAERPTHTAQSHLHTAADLRRGGWRRRREKQKQMNISHVWRFTFQQFPREQKDGRGGGRGRLAQRNVGCSSSRRRRQGKGPESLCRADVVALRVAIGARTFGSPSTKRPAPCQRVPPNVPTQRREEQAERRGPAAAWKPFWPVCC